jgi:hypothetical protein
MEAALRRWLGKLRDEQFYPITLVNTRRKWPEADGQIWAQFDPKEWKDSVNGVPRDIPKFLRRWDARDHGLIHLNLMASTLPFLPSLALTTFQVSLPYARTRH